MVIPPAEEKDADRGSIGHILGPGLGDGPSDDNATGEVDLGELGAAKAIEHVGTNQFDGEPVSVVVLLLVPGVIGRCNNWEVVSGPTSHHHKCLGEAGIGLALTEHITRFGVVGLESGSFDWSEHFLLY